METKNIQNQKPTQNKGVVSTEVLDKALGKDTTPQTTTEVKPEAIKTNDTPATGENISKTEAAQEKTIVAEAKPDTTVLDNILKNLPPAVSDKIRKLPAESQLDIAQDYFKMAHPEGLASEFKDRLMKELPAMIQKLAGEYLVSLAGKFVKISFPNGEGTSTTVEVLDPTEVSGKKGDKKSSERSQWGESTLTDKNGKVMAFETPGAMGKHLGLLMKGWQFTDTTDCFKKPHDLNTGNPITNRKFEIVSAEKGKGIHIKELAIA